MQRIDRYIYLIVFGLFGFLISCKFFPGLWCIRGQGLLGQENFFGYPFSYLSMVEDYEAYFWGVSISKELLAVYAISILSVASRTQSSTDYPVWRFPITSLLYLYWDLEFLRTSLVHWLFFVPCGIMRYTIRLCLRVLCWLKTLRV